jgi:hypothetical protein
MRATLRVRRASTPLRIQTLFLRQQLVGARVGQRLDSSSRALRAPRTP